VSGEDYPIWTDATGYLAHTTECDLFNLMNFPAVDGTVFYVRIQTISAWPQWIYTGCFKYQRDGATLDMDVKGGGFVSLKIENIRTYREYY
jgi:hypothetical protein